MKRPEASYGFSVIFSIYLLQFLINIGIIFFGRYNREIFTEDLTFYIFLIYLVLSFIIFVLIRKYNKNHNPGLAL